MKPHALPSCASRTAMILLTALLLGGCARVWVDAQGNRHAAGFLHISVPASGPSAAETLQVRTVGLSLTQAEAGTALVLGYSDTTLGFLRNDSCIVQPIRIQERLP